MTTVDKANGKDYMIRIVGHWDNGEFYMDSHTDITMPNFCIDCGRPSNKYCELCGLPVCNQCIHRKGVTECDDCYFDDNWNEDDYSEI